jgi:hypothetical protein
MKLEKMTGALIVNVLQYQLINKGKQMSLLQSEVNSRTNPVRVLELILQGWRIPDIAEATGVFKYQISKYCCMVQEMLTKGDPITFDFRRGHPARTIYCFRSEREYWMRQVKRLKAALGMEDEMPKPRMRPYPYGQHARNVDILAALITRETTISLATKYHISSCRVEAAGRRYAAIGRSLFQNGSLPSPGIQMSMYEIRSNPELMQKYLACLKEFYQLQ